jgi:hypothetical protein
VNVAVEEESIAVLLKHLRHNRTLPGRQRRGNRFRRSRLPQRPSPESGVRALRHQQDAIVTQQRDRAGFAPSPRPNRLVDGGPIDQA